MRNFYTSGISINVSMVRVCKHVPFGRLHVKYICIGIIMLAFACCTGKKTDKGSSKQITDNGLAISITKSGFPLRLANVDLQDTSSRYLADSVVNNAIQKLIADYYFNDCLGDSSETYFKINDSYLSTISLHDSIYTLYVVLLNHLPTGKLNSKTLFYNNNLHSFTNTVFDFKLDALYNYDDKPIPSTLNEGLSIGLPDIECVDYDGNGINDFKFVRLYHNGTANAIETIVLTISNNNIDTLLFERQWIN